ncbi:GNAT family N-acetyltransferase [Virgibacillus flavescens]|uniref:GNAT family N-acetyltransferase n=1 Tax=Virgibacillus flavescens TaxID=1611422 RepID=UPI003D353ED9
MELHFEKNTAAYVRLIEPLLMKRESCNNLMLGILNRFANEESADQNVHKGYVQKDGKVIYAFMQTPPNNWILPDVESINEDVAENIAVFLWENKLAVPGVLGPVRFVKPFVEKWETLSGTTSSLHMNQLIYQLDKVNDVPYSSGRLIEADRSHQQLVTDWLVQFGKEVNEPNFSADAEKNAHRFLDNRSVYLWEVDGKPVSMVNQSRKTKNGASVNAVFTPDEYKQNGYATSTVATLTSKLLDEGAQFCSLYTDADYPASNRIYKKIGYYQVGDSIVYEF